MSDETQQDGRLAVLDAQQSLQTEGLRAIARGDTDHLKAILEALDPNHTWDGSPKGSGAQLRTAIDVSSAQPRDLTALIGQYAPDHVILHTYISYERAGLAASTIAQAQSARAAGCTVGGYVWCFRGYDPVRTLNDALDTASKAGIVFAPNNPLWLDCETYGNPVTDRGPDVPWLNAICAEAARRGVALGIYTGAWWWNGYDLRGSTAFTFLPLWYANYGRDAEQLGAPGFGGWLTAAGHQWSASGVDQSVFAPQWAAA